MFYVFNSIIFSVLPQWNTTLSLNCQLLQLVQSNVLFQIFRKRSRTVMYNEWLQLRMCSVPINAT